MRGYVKARRAAANLPRPGWVQLSAANKPGSSSLGFKRTSTDIVAVCFNAVKRRRATKRRTATARPHGSRCSLGQLHRRLRRRRAAREDDRQGQESALAGRRQRGRQSQGAASCALAWWRPRRGSRLRAASRRAALSLAGAVAQRWRGRRDGARGGTEPWRGASSARRRRSSPRSGSPAGRLLGFEQAA